MEKRTKEPGIRWGLYRNSASNRKVLAVALGRQQLKHLHCRHPASVHAYLVSALLSGGLRDQAVGRLLEPSTTRTVTTGRCSLICLQDTFDPV
jgi:hypothetical protein